MIRRPSKRLRTVGITFALTLFAFLGVKITYHFLLSNLKGTLNPGLRTVLKTLEGTSFVWIGHQAMTGSISAQAGENVPKRSPRAESFTGGDGRRLNPHLSLIGTACGVADDTRAVIADAAKKTQRIFKIGDEVGGGVIEAISKDKVVIHFPWGDRTLQMNAVDTDGPAEGSVVLLERADLERALTKAHTVLSDLEIYPRAGEGGIELAGVKAGSFIDGLGFRNGDIINEFDGKSVDDPQTFVTQYNRFKLMLPALSPPTSGGSPSNGIAREISRNLSNIVDQIGSREQIPIVITRDGKRQIITYKLR